MSVEKDKIINALSNTRWDYRTAEGIAKETDIPIETVRTFVESQIDIVWKSSVLDPHGRALYMLKDRRPLSKEFWRNISIFISKTST